MKLSDFALLKKLMNMTLSGADQERLTAIDKANEIIAKSNTTWDRVLDRVIKVEVEIESRDAPPDPSTTFARREAFRKKIDEAFETIEASDPKADAADFIASLKSQWERNGSLSEAQRAALWKFEKNAQAKLEGAR